jgi:hypothetical protein
MASARKPEIVLGLLAGLAFAGWLLLEHVLGLNTTHLEIGHWTRLLSAFIGYGFVIAAVAGRWLRQGRLMTFQEGFASGAITVSIYSVIDTLVIALYMRSINPGFGEAVQAYEIERTMNAGASPAEITDQTLELGGMYSGSVMSFVLLFLMFVVWGLGLSAITALLLRRRPKLAPLGARRRG